MIEQFLTKRCYRYFSSMDFHFILYGGYNSEHSVNVLHVIRIYFNFSYFLGSDILFYKDNLVLTNKISIRFSHFMGNTQTFLLTCRQVYITCSAVLKHFILN